MECIHIAILRLRKKIARTCPLLHINQRNQCAGRRYVLTIGPR
jgi:hypothetical protein